MLILKGQLVHAVRKEADTRYKDSKPCQVLTVMSTPVGGREPRLYKVKDYEFKKLEVGKPVELAVYVNAYVIDGRSGISFKAE